MCSIFSSFFPPTSSINWDLIEGETGIQIIAEVPGYDESQITITYQNNILTLRAEKSETQLPSGSVYLVRDNHKPVSQNSYRVPSKVDIPAITAEYKNGIITITLPYIQQQTPQKITITSSNQSVQKSS